jgi:hypothetical protein
VSIINQQQNFHLPVDIEQSLDVERIRNFELLSFIVLETWAIKESQTINYYLNRSRSLRESVMANL